MATRESIQEILAAVPPLDEPRRRRLPLLVWTLTDLPPELDGRTTLRALDDRGLALISTWNHAAPDAGAGSLGASLALGTLQRDLGLEVCVNATALLSSFFDGSEATAHIDTLGRPFFDTSFAASVRMGCPFALEHREPVIRSRVELFADAYACAGVQPTLIFADWEIDGPLEWNGAWDASRHCARCRERIPDIDSFPTFQAAIRERRSRLQRACFAGPLTARFPGAWVGNYGVNPHGGVRYWYDYYEELPSGAPFIAEERARYRSWAHEFPDTGYTVAMPVLYPWSRSWAWYDRGPPDFRWVSSILLEASSAGRHTPRTVPIIPFVHWRPVLEDGREKPGLVPLSAEGYRELLWHVLLRGASTLFLWCPGPETLAELEPVHHVYRESLHYEEILASGAPVSFEVPRSPGPIVSGVQAGSRLLARRTDFGDPAAKAVLELDAGARMEVPVSPGRCTLLTT